MNSPAWQPLYPPITDKQTIAQLCNQYGTSLGMAKANGLCPETAEDLRRWRNLGRGT